MGCNKCISTCPIKGANIALEENVIVDEAKCEIQTIESITQHFAVQSDDFMDKEIDYHNLAEEMAEAEG
jgi:alpha-acetolactate decarboxylase